MIWCQIVFELKKKKRLGERELKGSLTVNVFAMDLF